jgi:regulatory protein YycH of two-component signal transduction system YycFG
MQDTFILHFKDTSIDTIIIPIDTFKHIESFQKDIQWYKDQDRIYIQSNSHLIKSIYLTSLDHKLIFTADPHHQIIELDLSQIKIKPGVYMLVLALEGHQKYVPIKFLKE